jgi:adenosylmethionine-8-amino-7-oxononanoate aminotransferase
MEHPAKHIYYHSPHYQGTSTSIFTRFLPIMGSVQEMTVGTNETFFYQSTHPTLSPIVSSTSGNYLILENGQKIIDSTGGAAVSAIGHGNERVINAIIAQLNKVTYAHPGYFINTPALELANLLVKSTGGKLARACLLGSGMFPRM